MVQCWSDSSRPSIADKAASPLSHHGRYIPKKLGEIDQQQSARARSAPAPRRQIEGKKWKNRQGGRAKNVERSNWQFELGMGHPHLHRRPEIKEKGEVSTGRKKMEELFQGKQAKGKWSPFSCFTRSIEGRNERR